MLYRNAKRTNDTGSIDCEINHPAYGWIPYTMNPEDTDMTVDNAELVAAIGSDVEAFIPPTQAELDVVAAKEIRERRDFLLLTEVDPIVSNVLRWADTNAVDKTKMKAYRRALLDVPQQVGFPNTHTWPVLA